jgi:hypothetical protein
VGATLLLREALTRRAACKKRQVTAGLELSVGEEVSAGEFRRVAKLYVVAEIASVGLDRGLAQVERTADTESCTGQA